MKNRYIDGPNMTLQDFYVWLGCHLFMAGFEGIKNNNMWWSEKTIDIFEGVPFRLSEYMLGGEFRILVQLYDTPILSRQPSLINSTMRGRLLKLLTIITTVSMSRLG